MPAEAPATQQDPDQTPRNPTTSYKVPTDPKPEFTSERPIGYACDFESEALYIAAVDRLRIQWTREIIAFLQAHGENSGTNSSDWNTTLPDRRKLACTLQYTNTPQGFNSFPETTLTTKLSPASNDQFGMGVQTQGQDAYIRAFSLILGTDNEINWVFFRGIDSNPKLISEAIVQSARLLKMVIDEIKHHLDK
ncbi:MAG: hypothetical protein WC651_01620 [Candidatus Gracilibacteria bacterium]|jgi:hypothetical protein